jgi:hypothetical protein
MPWSMTVTWRMMARRKLNPQCAWPKEDVCHPEHLIGMVFDTRTYEKHCQRVTVRNVTFPDVPGGPQDHEEPRGADGSHRMLCPVQSRCVQHQQVSSHDMTTVSCKKVQAIPREQRRRLLRRLKLIHPL